MPTWTNEITVSGNYAYAAAYTGGLKIVDISDTGDISLMESVSLGQAYNVTVSGAYAYVTAWSMGGVVIVELWPYSE